MSGLAEDAGVVVPRDAALLSEFAGIVAGLAEELFASHQRVLWWRVAIMPGEVRLEVGYIARGSGGEHVGSVCWTLLAILSDGASSAVRLMHAVRAALDESDTAHLPAAGD